MVSAISRRKMVLQMTSLGQSMSLQFTALLTLMGGAALKQQPPDSQSAMVHVAADSPGAAALFQRA